MVFSRILEIFLYLGLLGAAVVFVKQTVSEYLKGETSFTHKHEEVTLDDIPTLVICLSFEEDIPGRFWAYPEDLTLYPMTYGTDVVISLTVFGKENETVVLLKEHDVKTRIGLEFNLSELVLSWKQKCQCYKILTNWNSNFAINDQDFRMRISFSFPTASESNFVTRTREDDVYETGKRLNFRSESSDETFKSNLTLNICSPQNRNGSVFLRYSYN